MTDEQRHKNIALAGKHYGKAYLLMTIAMDNIDTGDIAVEKAGYMRLRIKQQAKRVQQAYDQFLGEFRRYISKTDGATILNDFDYYAPKINELLDKEKEK